VLAAEQKDNEQRQTDRRRADRRQESRRTTDLPKPGSLYQIEAFKLEKNQRVLYKAIGKLPAKQRAALLAHEYAGLSIEETALITGSPRWAVNHHIQRAKANVLKFLQEQDPDLHSELNEASIQTILDQYAEESITDEQMQRVFGPVSLMLEEEASKKKTRKMVWFLNKKDEDDEDGEQEEDKEKEENKEND